MFEELFAERGLSLDRLRVIVEIHEAGSIAQAAPGDRIRQGQYSRQLRELSEFFGCELSERRGKTNTLTPHGLKLALLARQQLRDLSDFRGACRSEKGVYSIAAGDSLIHWLAIPRLGAVSKSVKGVRFSVISVRTNDAIRLVSDCRVDFALVRKNAVVSGLKSLLLGKLTYVAAVPKTLVKGISPPQLRDIFADFPLVMQTTEGQFSKQVMQIATTFGATFRPALSCQSFPQAIAAVRSGRFAAIIPEIAMAELDDRAVFEVCDVGLRTLERDIVLAWNPRSIRVRPSASAVLSAIRSSFKLD